MSNLPLPKKDHKHQLIFTMTKEAMGFEPNSMLYMQYRPEVLYGFSFLAGAVLSQHGASPWKMGVMLFHFIKSMLKAKFRKNNTLSPELRYMVANVASNAAGCTYCQAHTEHSLHGKIPQEKLDQLFNFELSSLFTEKEKAALALALSGGSIPNYTRQEHFTRLERHFSKEEIIEIVSVIALFGFLNRWNDTLKTTLEPPFLTGE